MDYRNLGKTGLKVSVLCMGTMQFGWSVGETRVRRVLRQLGHTARIGRLHVRTTDSSHSHWRYPNLLKQTRPNQPDHVWVADITYIRLGYCFIYLAV